VNILHGKIEYFGTRAIGILIILLSGEEGAVARAIADIRAHVFSLTEIDRQALTEKQRRRAASVETGTTGEER
jgi:D-methionine transport system ATP-binding protein